MNVAQAFSPRRNFRSLYVRSLNNYQPIDGLRAISIILVVLFHAFIFAHYFFPETAYLNLINDTSIEWRWMWNGDKGVDIFFVISGFLIASLLFKEYDQFQTLRLSTFFGNRFLRLFPAYAVAITLYAVMGGNNPENIWANLLYINNFLPMSEMFMPWSWSLAVEEQFYVLLPLFLIAVFFKTEHKLACLVSLFLLSFVIRAIVLYSDTLLSQSHYYQLYLDRDMFNHGFSVFYDNLYTRYGNFVVGITVAYVYRYHNQRVSSWFKRKELPFLITILALIFIGVTLFSTMYSPKTESALLFKNLYMICIRNLFGLAIGWIILACLFPTGIGKLINRLLSSKIWYPIAQLSYSIYLFHLMVLPLVMLNFKANLEFIGIEYVDSPAGWLAFCSVFIFLLSIIIAIFSYVLIERPFMNLRRVKKSTTNHHHQIKHQPAS